ncbi:hypothetical protein H5392_02080 [Tessaracoccus sp. MC1865]|uniref:COX15/CtaA family protein n=1 Tax=Tessaracoccus sp. MC1865 TaxID=2760310 RepID=UPI001603C950|nr:COX15/CtaA family protein [Tessaracoccus sp. MC1865]MBB1482647.1 hypothetical protein [Tessaracoccus sp. MC1865]QTO37902.1 hypothetical protein J7D54_02010 [Tessaracoccus sp. MC1865]
MGSTTVFRVAAALLFTTIVLGSVVCATDSSSACPAWPVCYADQVAPAPQFEWLNNPAIEFVHRFIAFLSLVFTGWAGWLGRRSADVRVRVFPWVALGLAVGSAVFGMMIILFTLPLGLALIDVGGAMIAMTLMTVASAAVTSRGDDAGPPSVRRLGLGALVVLISMHLLGIVVAGVTSAGTGSFTRCISWPLWLVLDIDKYPALQVARIVMAAAALVLIAATVAKAARSLELRTPAVVLAALTVLELALGLLIRTQGLALTQTNGINATLAVLYTALASGIVWALGYVTGRAGSVARRSPEPTVPEAVTGSAWSTPRS